MLDCGDSWARTEWTRVDTSGHEWTRKCPTMRPPSVRSATTSGPRFGAIGKHSERKKRSMMAPAAARALRHGGRARRVHAVVHRASTALDAERRDPRRGAAGSARRRLAALRAAHPASARAQQSRCLLPATGRGHAPPRRGLNSAASPRHPSSVRSVRMRRCACRSPRRDCRRQPRRPRGLSDGGK